MCGVGGRGVSKAHTGTQPTYEVYRQTVKYRMRSNYSRTKLSRMEDFTIFAVFIFADAQVPNIILHIYAIYVI